MGLKRDELLHQLAQPRGDEEGSHSEAERLLVQHLRESGDSELADAWEKAQDEQNWWYA